MEERGGSGELAAADGGDQGEAGERAADDGGELAESAGNASELRGDGGAQRQPETGRGADTSGCVRRHLPVQLRLRGKDVACAAISGEEPGVRGEGESESEEDVAGDAEEQEKEQEQEQAEASEEDEEREQREQAKASEEDEEPCPATMLDVFRSIPTQMDYKGQKLAEQIFQGIILVSAVIGFIFGYVTEQFGWTVYIVMAGFALSCLLTLPPWPMYRRNPLKWLPVQESGTEDKKPADRKPKRHSKS
ncbi:signal peptidase complex subunit 1 [Tympanuchus pallidicinctus]|uniref:signal peptidase complex subunit 1 n=1 Tax=Tympanuchus pallidicinctus TaxID=109042 RepID=UPI00228766E8|nr:signal peptidase complex subunit 1 [Tympanuchus pallidicinctus]